ncbi:glycosyltransferase family 4 protein [Candidatus Peregrinibacteria bacterium]|jgi:glycosyltransferase involved in cell wall biosynthesis|nr:glycosyltransferase family 4 protein [Candidatus Peregrinibacteria bacterium]MBT5468065.1 glycosyltransferase family 4 protein [Candidatus Peregrinibacteria bacterium]MBT7337581.1 glycosyltransferase family 4 protein [Candidatus Peregrinibacteria bacterium]
MRVCILSQSLDAYKGGNHLPLLAACPNTEFTILTNRTRPKNPDLPSNVSVLTLGERIGSYYYGFADYLYAHYVIKKYPPSDPFWKQFDVIHLNQTMGTKMLQLIKTGVPVLYTVHHPATVDREVAIAESGFVEGLKWRAKYALLVRWQKKLCRKMPHIMTVSETSSKRLQDDYRCPASNIHVVYNGVDGEVFSLGKKDAQYDTIALGSFIHPRKGFPYLAEVYRKLSAEGKKIADVGRRSQEQQEILSTIPGVTMFGMIEQDQLVSLVQDSKTLVLTALYEGFGLSIIEALSTGRPPFPFDVGAVREVLRPIDETLISSRRDSNAVATKILQYLSLSEEERMSRGQKYRDAVLQEYSIEKAGQSLEGLYNKLLR